MSAVQVVTVVTCQIPDILCISVCCGVDDTALHQAISQKVAHLLICRPPIGLIIERCLCVCASASGYCNSVISLQISVESHRQDDEDDDGA